MPEIKRKTNGTTHELIPAGQRVQLVLGILLTGKVEPIPQSVADEVLDALCFGVQGAETATPAAKAQFGLDLTRKLIRDRVAAVAGQREASTVANQAAQAAANRFDAEHPQIA